jgi:phosphatidylglycerol---prolipoprotein diacylglyceryl transferase
VIPYFTLPTPKIGGIEFPWFMLLIVIGIAVGTEVARARAIRRDLSVKVTVDCTLFMVLIAFLTAHVFAIVFYHPDRLAADWKVLLPWVNFSISSMGGFLGAGLAIPFFLKVWKKAPAWPYVDNLALGITIGFAFGRIGCFTAHDHIGRPTNFFLGVNFPERITNATGQPLGTRHDLGGYEALLLIGIFILLLLIDRNKERFDGLLAGVLMTLYFPARFVMDALRATDLSRSDHHYRPQDLVAVAGEWLSEGGESAVDLIESLASSRLAEGQWLGFTFAQYGCIVLTAFGVWILVHRGRRGKMDISGEMDRDFKRRRAEAPDEPSEGQHPVPPGPDDSSDPEQQ